MGSSYYITYGGNRLTFPGATGSVAWEAPTYVYKELWHTDSAFRNMYSITLNDSIDNYDEYIVYGSAIRDDVYPLNTETRHVVVKNAINQGGCWYAGMWSTIYQYELANGTEMWLSGNSGYVGSSYYGGIHYTSSIWAQGVSTAGRVNDLHPYRIVGLKEVK